VAIWYILCLFGIFSPVLVCYTKRNLATLRAATVLGANGNIRKSPFLETALTFADPDNDGAPLFKNKKIKSVSSPNTFNGA
jgi:hypothetical protein